MKALRQLAENDIRWQCAGITKIRLTMPRVKMNRADRNPWLAKMVLVIHAREIARFRQKTLNKDVVIV